MRRLTDIDVDLSRWVVPATSSDDSGVSARLQDAYGLQQAVVVETPDDNPTTLHERIGSAAAELVAQIVTANDVLGLAWSRSAGAMTNALRQLPTIPVMDGQQSSRGRCVVQGRARYPD